MTMPVEVHFHGIDRSEAAEAAVQERVARLDKQFGRMTHCRVVIDAPHRHAHKKRAYNVKVEVGMAGHPVVVVESDRDYNAAHEDINAAIRDAFEAAKRQLATLHDKRNGPAKLERGRRRPAAPSGA